MKKTVLILDDDESLAKSLASEFHDHGYEPTVVHSLKEIPALAFDCAVVDIRLRGEFGLDAIKMLKKNSESCQIVVLSGYGSIATAVEAVKLGAIDYLTKPVGFELIVAALEGRLMKPEPDFKPQSLSQVEHEHIDFVLTKNQGNISKTAKDLGLHRQSLQRKLKKYT
ncbi:MAG: response regulator [Bdellovibrionaceae bacterium]|nr:response regulator [Pseudobdellovibrionaceae bacterium]